jgi:hypothetical protein
MYIQHHAYFEDLNQFDSKSAPRKKFKIQNWKIEIKSED